MIKTVRESAAAHGVHSEAECPYTWLEDHLERLEGKEARQEFYEHYFSYEYYSEAA